jgi:hypothetical protein
MRLDSSCRSHRAMRLVGKMSSESDHAASVLLDVPIGAAVGTCIVLQWRGAGQMIGRMFRRRPSR